jgi:hypothetical protein
VDTIDVSEPTRPGCSSGAEAIGPAEQLGADPHHQQYGWRFEVAETLVGHLDARRPDIQGLSSLTLPP